MFIENHCPYRHTFRNSVELCMVTTGFDKKFEQFVILATILLRIHAHNSLPLKGNFQISGIKPVPFWDLFPLC